MSIYKLKSTFQFIEPLFVKRMRGKMSQMEFSRQLGFDFNIVNRWEKSKRRLYWDDFVAICKIRKIAIRDQIFDLTGYHFAKSLSSGTILKKISRDSGAREQLLASMTKSRLNSLESDRARLPFAEWVATVEVLYGRAYRFLGHYFEMKKLEELAGNFANREEYARLLAKDPMIGVVRMSLGLKTYKALKKHRSGSLARLTGLTSDHVEQILNALTSCGIITWNGSHYEDRIGFFDLRTGGPEASHEIQKFWRNQIVEVNRRGFVRDGKYLSAFLHYKTSEALEKQVFELTARYYNELRALVHSAGSEEHQTIRYVNVEFLSVLENGDILYPQVKSKRK